MELDYLPIIFDIDLIKNKFINLKYKKAKRRTRLNLGKKWCFCMCSTGVLDKVWWVRQTAVHLGRRNLAGSPQNDLNAALKPMYGLAEKFDDGERRKKKKNVHSHCA